MERTKGTILQKSDHSKELVLFDDVHFDEYVYTI